MRKRFVVQKQFQTILNCWPLCIDCVMCVLRKKHFCNVRLLIKVEKLALPHLPFLRREFLQLIFFLLVKSRLVDSVHFMILQCAQCDTRHIWIDDRYFPPQANMLFAADEKG